MLACVLSSHLTYVKINLNLFFKCCIDIFDCVFFLVGPIKVFHLNETSDEEIQKLENENFEVRKGGKWSPKCQARHKVSRFF